MLITEKKEIEKYSDPHRVWQGIPGIVHTKGGRTFVSLYSGDVKETYGNFAVLLMSNGHTDFEHVAVVKKEGQFRVFDPVLWIDPMGRLWFIWNVMPGEQVMASVCDDPDAEVLQWSEPKEIGRGIMMNKPIVLSTGEWIFPIAIWLLDIYTEFRKAGLREDDEAGSYVYKTSDCGKTFQRLGMANIRKRSFDEHMVYEQRNGVLKMLVRTTYGIGAAYSYDRGKNWSKGENSGLGGPCSRFYINRLKSGRLLLINHHNFKGRNNLTAFLSDDDGKTWPYSLLLDERKQVSYPDAMEADDGFIYIVYDRERGCFKENMVDVYASAREILTCRIKEEDIMAGHLVTEGAFLKNVVSKLGELMDPDPFAESPADEEAFARQLIESGDEDIIGKVFAHYPVNCINIYELDAKRLDMLVARFRETGNNDLELLLQIIAELRGVPKSKTELYPVVKRVKAYIEETLKEEVSVSAIAEYLHISVYYLSHLFKSVTGTTVVEYRNELRLTKAKLMLIQTELPVNQIAQETGFTSASYFTEIFTKSEKIPPSEYRKYHR